MSSLAGVAGFGPGASEEHVVTSLGAAGAAAPRAGRRAVGARATPASLPSPRHRCERAAARGLSTPKASLFLLKTGFLSSEPLPQHIQELEHGCEDVAQPTRPAFRRAQWSQQRPWSRTHPGSPAHEVAGRRWTGAGLVPVPAGHALPTSGFLFRRPAQSLCCAGELLWESVEAVPRCTPKVLHYRLSCLCG